MSAVLSLHNGLLNYGGQCLIEECNFHIYGNDRIGFIGANGSGKSSLLKVLQGKDDALQAGELVKMPGVKLGFLQQEKQITDDICVSQYLTKQTAAEDYEIQAMADSLGLDLGLSVQTLSGGQRRRLFLAECLLNKPNLLLLDEPTNHLDMQTILWLENYINKFRGSVIIISHDRAFLENTTTKCWWIYKKKLYVSEQGFRNFDDWQHQVLSDEQRYAERLQVKLKQELHWKQRGVTARRKRNQGRLSKLQDLKQEKQDLNAATKHSVSLSEPTEKRSSKSVIEAKDISFSYGNEKPIIMNFSCNIMAKDRIGVIGNNGSGKTTLLKLLLKQLEPTSGAIKHGKTLEITYIDQQRIGLDPNDTLWQALCPAGGDQVYVNGEYKHVNGYLKDFLFSDAQIHGKVGILSGGEKNRLLLAIQLANVGSLLVLDEPTNDLDLETLELLEDYLMDYPGTAIIVSHDRDFLDKTTAASLILDSQSNIYDRCGGYSDNKTFIESLLLPKGNNNLVEKKSKKSAGMEKSTQPQRLSYKLQREFDLLPGEIQTLEKQIREHEAFLHNPNSFQQDSKAFAKRSQAFEDLKKQLEQAENRWLEISMMLEA